MMDATGTVTRTAVAGRAVAQYAGGTMTKADRRDAQADLRDAKLSAYFESAAARNRETSALRDTLGSGRERQLASLRARTAHLGRALDRLERGREDHQKGKGGALRGLAAGKPRDGLEVLRVSYEAEARVVLNGVEARAQERYEAARISAGGREALVAREFRSVETPETSLSYDYVKIAAQGRGSWVDVAFEQVSGGDGADTIGNAEIDAISGGQFGLRGAVGAIDAGGGDDLVRIAGLRVDRIDLGAGNDTLIASLTRAEDVIAGAGDDVVSLSVLADARVSGGEGNDTLAVTAGIAAYAAGGAGDDAISVSARLAQASGGDGNDVISVSGQFASADGGDGNDEIAVAASAVREVSGGSGDDMIAVNADRVGRVAGGDGNDAIAIEAGHAAWVSGGTGDDVIVLNVDSARLGFARGDGQDRVVLAAGAALDIRLDAAIVGAPEDMSVAWSEDGTATISFASGESLVIEGAGAASQITIGAGMVDLSAALARPPRAPVDIRV